MLPSLLWGGLAAFSLVVGAGLAFVRRWSDTTIGMVLAFGAGALIASVSFELAEEGLRVGGAMPVAVGLALGAVLFLVADKVVEKSGGRDLKTDGGDPAADARSASAPAAGGTAGVPLAVGALLDGIPEQLVLGIGLAAGGGVSLALLVAIFLSNLPEAIGSSSDMREAGKSRGFIMVLWIGVAVLCTGASVLGYAISDLTSPAVQAGINGFAAGALLVMLIDSVIPEAREKARDQAGLATVVGFAVAAGLSLLA